jgi:Sigma-70 region 2
VTSHLRLVIKIAKGCRGYGLPILGVISEGNVGLMQALKRFEPEKGFRLATYAACGSGQQSRHTSFTPDRWQRSAPRPIRGSYSSICERPNAAFLCLTKAICARIRSNSSPNASASPITT